MAAFFQIDQKYKYYMTLRFKPEITERTDRSCVVSIFSMQLSLVSMRFFVCALQSDSCHCFPLELLINMNFFYQACS